MPNFAVVLTMLILGAVFFAPAANEPLPDEDDVIVSAGVGGLARPGERTGGNTANSLFRPPSINTNIQAPVTQEPAPEPQSPVDTEPVPLPPIVSTYTAQNIETTRADLRASVTFIGQPYRSTIFFRIADTESRVGQTEQTGANSTTAYQSGIVTDRVFSLEPGQTYFYQACLEGAIICGDVVSFTTEPDYSRNDTYYRPSASLARVTEVQSESAVLEGSYRMRDSTINSIFFVYGLDSNAVRTVDDVYNEYDDIEEDRDNLQKVRAGVNQTGDGERTRTIDDLERDEEYSARFCVAYDDEEQGIVCSSTRTFTTRNRDKDTPSFALTDALVENQTANFSSRVSMEDYFDGLVFLVFGTSLERVEAVSDRDRLSQINQAGNELQRRTLRTDFDGEALVTYNEANLLPGPYFYRFCVEYEAEDYRGIEKATITCSDTRPIAVN
jgi:hypothetical protein